LWWDRRRSLRYLPTIDQPTTRPRLFPLVLTTAGLFAACLPLLPRRYFDPDEFEHAHAAWSLFRGLVLYKDFFEHHTPWYYYALRPLFFFFDVDASFVSATRLLFVGRLFSLALAILSVVLVVRIGTSWHGRRVGLLAGLLLVAQPVFLEKTIEMRPDVFAMPFFFAALWFLLRGLATERPREFIAAGVGVGAAIMCTQKMLFVLPGAMVGLGLWALSKRTRFLLVVVFGAFVLLPVGLTGLAFYAQGAGREFVTNNFLLNANWRDTPTGELFKLVRNSWPVLALALWGIRESRLHARLRDPQAQGDLLLVCTMLGLFAGVAVVPVAYRQYYLMPLPIACLLAARSALSLATRAPRWLVVVGIAVMALLPLNALRIEYFRPNDQQLSKLRHVYETTGPMDVVMDGWKGMGVFRPHAFRYFFLHEEIVAMLPPAHLDAYLDDLEAGRIRPKLIAFDENLAALGPRFRRFVDNNYVATDGFFYYARDR
jgi:hypothetical protein